MTRHLAAIIDSSADAIVSESLDGTILSWNKAAQVLYGYTREEMVGGAASLLVPSERADEVNETSEQVRRGEAVHHFQTIRRRKDGSMVEVSLTISPLRDESGEVVAASTIARDISDRRRSDDLRFRLAAIVDSSDDAILSKSLEGTILSWNKAAERLYGYTAEEVVGHSISILVPSDRRDEVIDILRRVRNCEAVEHFETIRRRKDGGLVPVSLTISPVLDASGRVVAASTIARDITERNRLLKELEDARDKAMEVSRLKSDFLATMSHEIRTPMNGVIGMTGLLLDTELDPQQREYAETVRASGEALLAIINDILDFSKIEADKLELEIIDFDLRLVIEEVASLLAEQAQAKGLELLIQVPSGMHTAVTGDPGRLRQVLTNLVGNAIKFTEHGEVAITARAEDETEKELTVRLAVSDTGPGIPAGALPALFEPFSQADTSTTRLHGGTGLGLAIVKRLSDLMGGEIAVASEIGRGTTFNLTVTFPKGRRIDSGPSLTPDLSGLRVLIVDDNATNRRVLTHQVASWGMQSQDVASGLDALERLSEATRSAQPYGLVLLDMEMPGMNGLELARRIRSDEGLRNTRLVMLTSVAIQGLAASAEDVGVSGYLTKPVRQSQLFDSIVSAMSERWPPVPRRTAVEGPTRAVITGRPRLLVAEDNTVNQKVAAAMLAKLGYCTDLVANGAEALEAVGRRRYGAVLMDCQMPEMDGYQASIEIRKRETSEHIPIIAMTAGAMPDDRERCLAAGMDDYLPKPVKLDDLAETLQRWVRDSEERPGASDAASETETSEQPIVVDLAVIDEDAVAELIDITSHNPAKFVDLVRTFERGIASGLERLGAALDEGHLEEAGRALHALRGSAGSIGARGFAQACAELEERLAEHEGPISQESLSLIMSELKKLEDWIQSVTA